MKPNDTNGLWDDGYLMKSTRERQRQVRVATGAMYRCPMCKGTNVLIAIWTNPNTADLRWDGGDAPVDPWCDDCEDHVKRLEYNKEGGE